MGPYGGKMLVELAESGCPIFLSTTPLSRGRLKTKGHGNESINYCAISSVFTEQSHKYVKNTKTFTTERGNRCERTIEFLIRATRDPRQTCLWIVQTLLAKIFYCNNMENELKSYHNKTSEVNFVWMQDF